jgi:hypothetical protein
MNIEAIKVFLKKHPAGAAAIITTLIMCGAIYVRHLSMSEQQAAFDVKSAEGQRLSANISHSNQLDEHVRALEEANKTIAGRLVNPQDLAINLQYFYKLEADTGVKLLDTRPTAASTTKLSTAKGAYVPVQYAVSLQASYVRALTFLRRLEQGNYYCRVVSASCSLAGQSGGPDKAADEIVLTLTVDLLGRS